MADTVHVLMSRTLERAKTDPGFALKLATGLVLGMIGLLIFTIEASRSHSLESEHFFVDSFPIQKEILSSRGKRLPSATVCPAVSVERAGALGIGQINRMKCTTLGFLISTPPVSVIAKTITKTDPLDSNRDSTFHCWNINVDMKFIAQSPQQTIKCDAYISNFEELSAAEGTVTFWDLRNDKNGKSWDNSPMEDQFTWHSLHDTSFTSMYIVPKEVFFLDGRRRWYHKSVESQFFKNDFEKVRSSKGTLPALSLSYGFQQMYFREEREVNLYTSNRFWGTIGGISYLLFGMYLLLVCFMSSYVQN